MKSFSKDGCVRKRLWNPGHLWSLWYNNSEASKYCISVRNKAICAAFWRQLRRSARGRADVPWGPARPRFQLNLQALKCLAFLSLESHTAILNRNTASFTHSQEQRFHTGCRDACILKQSERTATLNYRSWTSQWGSSTNWYENFRLESITFSNKS